jgi:hypothetical protein
LPSQATPNPICSTVLRFLNERSSDSACSPIALRRAASAGSTPFASMTLPTIYYPSSSGRLFKFGPQANDRGQQPSRGR